MKKEYVAPTVTELGSLSELTLAGSDGDFLDMTYIAGTSRGSLTFS